VNEENGKIEIGASLTVHASCFVGCSTDTNPVNSEEMERTDVGISCYYQDVMDARQSFSLIKEKHQLNESDEDGRHFDHTTAYDTVGVEEIDTMHPSEAVGLNHIGPDLFDTERISRTCHTKKEVDLKGGVLEKSDDSNEESIQLTPVTPRDSDIFDKPEAYTNVNSRVKCVSKRVDRVIGRPLDETTPRSNRFAGDNIMDSKISKRKLVIYHEEPLRIAYLQA
jgi:hypothetical protein